MCCAFSETVHDRGAGPVYTTLCGFLGIRYAGSPGTNSFPERARVRGKLRILEPSLESSGYVHSARDHERWRVCFFVVDRCPASSSLVTWYRRDQEPGGVKGLVIVN